MLKKILAFICFVIIDGSPVCVKDCGIQSEIVCGNNGKTYNSVCDLENAACVDKNLKVAYYGLCQNIYSSLIGLNFEPICGSNGRTYSNVAFLTLHKCITGNNQLCKVSNGPCECQRLGGCPKTGACISEMVNDCLVCRKKCPQTGWYKGRRTLLCASDGREYTLEKFQLAQCMSDGKLTKISDGPCPKRSCQIRRCPKTFFPLCGSNIRTYPNECFFNNAQCLNEGQRNLTTINNGPCERGSTEQIVGSMFRPVCGSDGNIYFNSVSLQVQQCIQDVDVVPCPK